MLRVLTALENVFSRYIPWHSEKEMRDSIQAIEDLIAELKGENSQNVETPTVEAPDPTNLNSAVTEIHPVASTADAMADTTTPVPSVSESTMPVVNATDATAAVNTSVTEPVHIPEPEPTPFPGSYTPPPAA